MRILITDTYYGAVLRGVYAADRGLIERPYAEQLRTLLGVGFGTSDFYSWNLRQLGHEAADVITNCTPLQRQWARENMRGFWPRRGWLHAVLAAQIEQFKPDVLYVQDMNWTQAPFYRSFRRHVGLIVGQTAYALQPRFDYGGIDLVLTSFPHYVPLFRRHGLASEYMRLAFEPRVLEWIGTAAPEYGAVFVGGISASHRAGTELLNEVAGSVRLDTWGYGYDQLPGSDPLRRHHHGSAFGIDMYRVLARSRVALNRHIDLSGRFANNMRLFEATGVGTCLVTDLRDNLAELFEPGKEVVAYRDAQECAEMVRYYLDHEAERAAIAAAGQRRTLREHTYALRMQETVEVIRRYMDRRAPERPVFFVGPPEASSRLSRVAVLARTAANGLAPGLRRLAATLGERVRRRPDEIDNPPHRRIPMEAVSQELVDGWRSGAIPARQRRVAEDGLTRMYLGEPPAVYRVGADAVAGCGLRNPTVLDVGCASGYYVEVLGHLLRHRPRYVGLDYSAALIDQARDAYPDVPFLVGDAACLPFERSSFDVLFSGTVLLAVPDYRAAIAESARVARSWCIFHRTPVVARAGTSYWIRRAYEVETVELTFNEAELRELFAENSLRVARELEVERYRLAGLDEEVVVKTFVCARGDASPS